MTEHMEPFRHLLKSDTPYCWSPILQEKFEMAKEMIIEAVTKGVERFKMRRRTSAPWPQISPKVELVSFCYRSTANMWRSIPDVAMMDGSNS